MSKKVLKSNASYSEFMRFVDEEFDRISYILDYGDWFVIQVDNDKYYFYEAEMEGASDFWREVELIAELKYDVLHDVKVEEKPELFALFDCAVSGEYVTDDAIYYLWFDEKKEV